MRTFSFLYTVMIFISLQVVGQVPDTLYLKNGSIAFGRIVENSRTNVKIKTVDGLLFSFSPEEIERSSFAARKEDNTGGRDMGLSFNLESGIPIGSSDEGFPIHFSVNPMVDYVFDPYNSVSAGTGLEYWEKLMMPLFVEYRLNTSVKDVTPFLHFRVGALIHLPLDEDDENFEYDYKHGWTFSTGMGLLWPLGKIESYVKMGYRYAHARFIEIYSFTDPPVTYDNKSNFNCFEMKWG
ncbi:MAG: hypothetical protein MUE74_13770, partial [Bacteroidales bacterium]|nr:hypothetical protein [Bacteroidales bacterium]